VLRGLAGVVVLPGILAACTTDRSGQVTVSGAVPASEVPVGAARVVDVSGARVVLAQPTAGEFVAFSASCTHAGTPVVAKDGMLLVCPNHGSEFDASDGSVQRGPAKQPLATVPVQQDGDDLVLG